jgi:hypothetical protein
VQAVDDQGGEREEPSEKCIYRTPGHPPPGEARPPAERGHARFGVGHGHHLALAPARSQALTHQDDDGFNAITPGEFFSLFATARVVGDGHFVRPDASAQ